MTPPSRSLPSPFKHRTGFAALFRSALFFVAACALLTAATGQISLKTTGTKNATSVVQTEQVRAELVAHAPDGVNAGKSVWVGLQLQHQPQWHTYWKNPGDSGLPTELHWTLPAGATAGDIAWPAPQLIRVGAMGNYGYGDTVLLPVPLTIAKSFSPSQADDLEIGLKATWLVCRQECIPQEGNFVLHVPVRGSTALHGPAFDAARAAAPQALPVSASAKVGSDALRVQAKGLPAAWLGKELQVFPEAPNIADPSTSPSLQAWEHNTWSATLPLSVQRDSAPADIALVLALDGHSVRAVVPISGIWPTLPDANAAGPTVAGTSVIATTATRPVDNSWSAWSLALVAALLGGLLLNLMPCVLPVLAIKVLGFSQHARHYQAAHRAQGLAYTAGVMLSFTALGALMLVLRATGEQLGWGFQLQSPAVLAALATLFTLLGLNLAGVFEIGSVLPHRLAALQARHPTVDAFLSGVLAVAIASPCTAPFMGASLGYAITLPATQAMGIFAALGLGLALPFLLASWIPAVGRWLPQPGAWMDTMRRFMAFPMFATVVWLLWVLGHLTGVDGAASLLALLVCLALVAWSLGLEGRSQWIFATISIASCAVLTGAIGQNVLRMEAPEQSGTAASSLWQPWTPGRVEAELGSGHPVFVDFTAAWCITCQFNKKTTLGQAEVLADFRAHQVTLLRADWTRRDPTITLALEQLGRSGVPVYVLYQKGQAPVLFSEILSAQDLRTAIARL